MGAIFSSHVVYRLVGLGQVVEEGVVVFLEVVLGQGAGQLVKPRSVFVVNQTVVEHPEDFVHEKPVKKESAVIISVL